MNKSEKIRLIYDIVLSVLTAAVGIEFIITVANLYYTGKEQGLEIIYTVDRITQHLTLPLVFLFVWIAAIIAAFVLSVVFPVASKKKPNIDEKALVQKLSTRIPTQGETQEFTNSIAQLKKLRFAKIITWAITTVALIAFSVIILVYVFDPDHFTQTEFLSDKLTLVRNVIFFIGGGFVVCIIATVIDGVLSKRELACIKKAIATGDKTSVPQPKTPKQKAIIGMTILYAALSLLALLFFTIAPAFINKIVTTSTKAFEFISIAISALALVIAGILGAKVAKKYALEKADKIILLFTRIAVGCVAIAFIIVGATNGGASDVLTKAINICTECIGLG